jgi:hypothetical protein
MINASLNGALGFWKMGYDGSAAWAGINGVAAIGAGWAVEGIADYNNDGDQDILFYNAGAAAAGMLSVAMDAAGVVSGTWSGLGAVNSAWQIL